MTADDRVDVEGLITSADNLKGQLRRAAEGGYTVGRTKGFCEDAAQMLSRLTTRLSALLDEVEGLNNELAVAQGCDPQRVSTAVKRAWALENLALDQLAAERSARARAEGLVEVAREAMTAALDGIMTDENPQFGVSHLFLAKPAHDALEAAVAQLSSPQEPK